VSWQDELDDLERRRVLARQMGGPEKVARHEAAGKLTVRARVDALLDAGSFREFGSIAGVAEYDASGAISSFMPANSVTGYGMIDGRPIAVTGDDFTVRGGANDGGLFEKIMIAERMAHDLRLPLVRLVDGTGGGGSVKTIEIKGRTYVPALHGWEFAVANLARVPVVGLALGSVAGLGAARVAASHYSLMVKGLSQVFTAGPPVVARIGENLTKEELGGSHIHTRNGVVDDEVESELEAFERVRGFLSYLPRNVDELPARHPCDDDPSRRDEMLLSVIPRAARQVYKVRPIIETLLDYGSFFEIGRFWGRSCVTGFGRLKGLSVALIASDPMHYAGAWTARSSEKLVRFIDLAQTFHLPVIHLVDVPGFQIGLEAERAATLRYGVRAMAAIYQASVPWCSVIMRRAFGVAGASHQATGRFNMRFAWPSAEWGSLPIAGGLEAADRADLDAAPDRAAKLAEIEARLNALTSPLRSAEAFLIDEIIDPRDTRRRLCEFADLAAPALRTGASQFGMRP
jgi:acetyl-CoA carboxylase carboxyltransferase component